MTTTKARQQTREAKDVEVALVKALERAVRRMPIKNLMALDALLRNREQFNDMLFSAIDKALNESEG